MKLLFKPRNPEYIGKGTLPFGTFEDTDNWQPLTKYLEQGAETFPDKTLFSVADTDGNINNSFTYAETNGWSNRVANGLKEDYGISKGEKVGIYMLNRPEYVVSILACHKTGAVQVPINKDEKGDRLSYVINYSEMIVLIVDPESVEFIEEIAQDLENLQTIFLTGDKENVPEEIAGIKTLPFSKFDSYSSDNPNVEVTIKDAERCMFTSGTTGMPKGVSRNHGGVVLTVRGFIQQQGIRSDDVLMSVLTLGHANAQVMGLFSAIGAGSRCCILPQVLSFKLLEVGC